MWDEIPEASTPRKPLMMGAGRDVEVGFDARITQRIDQSLSTEVLFRTATQVQVMHLFVELIGTGEDSVVGRLDIQTEDGSAEGTHVGELVHIGQHNIERLVTTP